jgi:hypothetical protein
MLQSRSGLIARGLLRHWGQAVDEVLEAPVAPQDVAGTAGPLTLLTANVARAVELGVEALVTLLDVAGTAGLLDPLPAPVALAIVLGLLAKWMAAEVVVICPAGRTGRKRFLADVAFEQPYGLVLAAVQTQSHLRPGLFRVRIETPAERLVLDLCRHDSGHDCLIQLNSSTEMLQCLICQCVII